MSLYSVLSGVVSRVLPAVAADQSEKTARVSRYGELVVEPKLQDMAALNDEGSYFVAVQDALAYQVVAATDVTKPALVLVNGDAVGGKRVHIDFIKMQVTTAPASGTAANFRMDLSNTALRYTSGGTLLVPVSPNMDSAVASISRPYVGSIVAPNVVPDRIVDIGSWRTVIPVVGDTVIFNFGTVEKVHAAQILNGTNPTGIQVQCPPVCLGPGGLHSFNLLMWFPSNASTAASLRWTIGWWER